MKAIFFLTISTILWGLNFHLAKVMLSQVNFIEAGFWRYIFGVIPLTLLTYKDFPSLKLIIQNLKGISIVAIVGLFGFNIFFFWGMMHTTAVNAALIMSLNPAITIFISNRVLKTPFSRKHIIGILVSFMGVVYLLSKGNLVGLNYITFSYGDMLILIANILFALHHVWVKKYATNISSINFTLLTSYICLVCFIFPILLLGMDGITTHSLVFWLSAIGIGCFGTAIAYYMWNEGIKLTGADQAGIFMNLVPLSAATLSVFFSETIYSYHFISGLLIALGIFIMKNRLMKKHEGTTMYKK